MTQFARINASSLINIEKIFSGPNTKFYNNDDVNTIAPELRLTMPTDVLKVSKTTVFVLLTVSWILKTNISPDKEDIIKYSIPVTFFSDPSKQKILILIVFYCFLLKNLLFVS